MCDFSSQSNIALENMVVFLKKKGGPKLRKWYGAADPLQKDGVELREDENPGLRRSKCHHIFLGFVFMFFVDDCVNPLLSEEEKVRDAVLVTNGDNEIGQVMLCLFIIYFL